MKTCSKCKGKHYAKGLCRQHYWKSDKHKACQKAYQKSDKYKAYQKAYQKSDKYKACQKAYQKSDKYKAYLKKKAEKAHILALQHREESNIRKDLQPIVKEYHFLLGLTKRTQRQQIRLLCLADYLGRDYEEWQTEEERRKDLELKK